MVQNLFASLRKWDIEFDMGPEMLRSILEYAASFRHELYIKFFDKRMFIQSRSSDNTQYTDITIDDDGLQNYNPNIPEGMEEKYTNFTNDEKIKYRNIFITPEGPHKRVLLNLIDKSATTPMGELLMFLGKNPVKVKIDTLVEKKVEFGLQRGMFIWWRLMDPNSEDTKAVENMPSVVNRIRNNPNIGKAILTMEPGLFKRIVNLGGKPGKSGNAHTRGLFEIDVGSGLTVASGDNMRGRVLKLGVLGSNLTDYDSLGNRKKESYESEKGDDRETDRETMEKEQPFVSQEEFQDDNNIGKDTDYDTEEFQDDDNIDNINEDLPEEISIKDDMFANDEVPFLTNDDISGRSGKNKQNKKKEEKNVRFKNELDKEEKKKRSSKKKEEENIMDEAITNDLSSAEVDVKTQIWMEIPYLAPILKLNGLAPIMIEMRNGLPLVVTQKPFLDMYVLLTIAPRIETDDID